MKKGKVNWIFFGVGVLAVVIICMTGEIAIIDGRNFSVFEVILMFSEEEKKRYSCFEAFSAGITGWLSLVLPVLVSMPTIPLFNDEINSNYYQYSIGRIGLKQYVKRKYIDVVMYGSGLLIVGLLIYGLLTYCLFPIQADYGVIEVIGQRKSLFVQFYNELEIILKLVLWGGSIAATAYVCASLFSSKYVILCIPFLFNYAMRNIMWKYTFLIAVLLLFVSYIFGCQIWKWKYRRLLI